MGVVAGCSVMGSADERQEALGTLSLVVDQRSAPVRDELVSGAVNEQEWRRLREVVVTGRKAFSGARHHHGRLDSGIEATRIGHEAQRGDRSIRVTGGTDLLGVDQAREGSANDK